MTENILENTKKKHSKIIIVSLIYIISALLYLFLRIGGKFGIFNFLGTSKNYILNIVNQIIFIAGVPILLFSLFETKNLKRTFKQFKFSKIPGRIVWLSFLMGIVLYGVVVFLSSAWLNLIGLTGYKNPLFKISFGIQSPFAEFGAEIVLTCLLPAVCEEVLLRGCVLSGLENMGRKRAIIFVGLLFGFLHINVEQVFYASILGMFLCVITMMTGSIWPAIIMHFTSNFCSVFLNFIFKLNLFNGELNRFINTLFYGNVLTSIVNYLFIAFIVIYCFIMLFARFLKYSKSKSLYDKLSAFMLENNLTPGEKVEINEQTGDNLIEMKNIVQAELFSQLGMSRRPFDFILPPTAHDKYKPTVLEWVFVIAALVLTGGATLASFIGGIL